MTAPKPPLAVRLARLTFPTWPTGDTLYWVTPQEENAAWLAEDPEHRSVTELPTALGKLSPDGLIITRFRAWSLDDLSKAERRVVEAGLGGALGEAISGVLFDQHFSENLNEAQQMILLYTATATQRAVALEEVLDAHPELEKQQ